ncbi:hypothetical protein Acj9p230 [Acinetobacter phage Acj9]|uniref:Uncharacterized protein n=1 Tax=Acinetobacter phage Acj9 TaxID=760939 RepID=E5EQ14_9CAUD|nr:hypothetical protein Acj9p230 [Acinetobacter phage Acj9]ADG60130.1 hypothetical protein Acj9p230 [Acinetobacter phage Acj9]
MMKKFMWKFVNCWDVGVPISAIGGAGVWYFTNIQLLGWISAAIILTIFSVVNFYAKS